MTALLAFFVALLAFGSFGFWFFSFVVFCAITALVENDEGVWATIVFIGTVLSLNFLSKIPLLVFIKTNPGTRQRTSAFTSPLASLGHSSSGEFS